MNIKKGDKIVVTLPDGVELRYTASRDTILSFADGLVNLPVERDAMFLPCGHPWEFPDGHLRPCPVCGEQP